MSDKNRAIEVERKFLHKELLEAISLEVEEICARADRICDIVARSEGYSDFKEYEAALLSEQEDLFAKKRIRAVNDT